MEFLQIDEFVKVRKTLSFYEKLVVLKEILAMDCICKALTLCVDEVRTCGPKYSRYRVPGCCGAVADTMK